MISVGITGGIGSGKTTVCSIFEQFGVPVYYADEMAKSLYQRDEKLRDAVKELLGEDAFDHEGSLNRVWVKEKVFSDPTLLKGLNDLVHPRIFKDFELWCNLREVEGHKYVLKEAAILFESGAHETVDVVVGVLASKEVRKQRAMDRGGLTEADVESRMLSQWPQEAWEDRCEYLIHNDGTSSLIEQVVKIHKALLKLAN